MDAESPTPARRWSLISFIRNRILQGLLVVLPIALTYWIVAWLYTTLRELFLDDIIAWVIDRAYEGDITLQRSFVFVNIIAPLIAILIVVCGLYVLGMFLHSRLHRLLDWTLLHVPVVMTIYSAIRKVVHTMGTPQAEQRFKRVVLIPFPHPGMKVPAFVTSSCVDSVTGKNILCVYVPTTPVPTSGYMLMLPEEEVTELSWSLDETLQAIVSGGITVPERVEYFSAQG